MGTDDSNRHIAMYLGVDHQYASMSSYIQTVFHDTFPVIHLIRIGSRDIQAIMTPQATQRFTQEQIAEAVELANNYLVLNKITKRILGT